VVLHPEFDRRLGSMEFDYSSTYGAIHSDWSIKGNTALWHVTIPANTTGRLVVNPSEAARYKLAGVPLPDSKQAKPMPQSNNVGFELAAGTYAFEVEIK
jgi:alpha-L-rhamnosidase